MGWMVNATPRPLYPREWLGVHCIGGWVEPRAGLDGCGKSRPHRDSRSPDRPAQKCSNSYRQCSTQYKSDISPLATLWGGQNFSTFCLQIYPPPPSKDFLHQACTDFFFFRLVLRLSFICFVLLLFPITLRPFQFGLGFLYNWCPFLSFRCICFVTSRNISDRTANLPFLNCVIAQMHTFLQPS